MSFNKITIVGNLGRDPELRYTPNGSAVANLSVATTEKKRGSDGEYNNVTTWFRVTLWGKQAEAASQYLSKGDKVYLEGRLRIEEWTDKEGNNRFNLEVNGSDMQFLGGGNGNGRSQDDGLDEGFDEEDEAPARSAAKKPAAKKPAPKKQAPKSKAAVAAASASDDDDDIPF